jgi:hypothetical protein
MDLMFPDCSANVRYLASNFVGILLKRVNGVFGIVEFLNGYGGANFTSSTVADIFDGIAG